MKILHTAIIMIAIVLMIIVSPMTYSTLSFAARANNTGTGTQYNKSTTSPPSKIPNINTPKITTKNPVAHNATTLMGSGNYPGSHPCSNTDKYLWDHVYGKTDSHGNIRLKDSPPPLGSCVTVTGTVYSQIHLPPSTQGTHEEDDGDLHFTLTLDPKYEQYSNSFDPPCQSSHGLPNPCHNIIVEVICHNPINKIKYASFGGGHYCDNVKSVFPGMPAQSQRLSVSGRFVQDVDQTSPSPHKPWNEIHPTSNIQ